MRDELSTNPSESEFSKKHFLAVGASENEDGNITFKPAVVTVMPCTWIASNGFVSVGESDGVVKGIGAGKETIICKYDASGKGGDYTGTASCNLIVSDESSDDKPEITPIPSEITGPEQITLTEGYADTEYSYHVTGNPMPQAILERNNTAGARLENGKITVPAGLSAGEYTFTITAENSAGKTVKTVRVIVNAVRTVPLIDGNNSVNLAEGYSDMKYRYLVTGTPEPALTLDAAGNTAKAVLKNGTVTIPAGLAAGSYSFTLRAANSEGETVKTVKVNVTTEQFAPAIDGNSSINLTEDYTDMVYSYSVTGNPEPTVSVEFTDNTAGAVLTDGIITVPAGLSAGSYGFTLTAENSVGKASKTVLVYVAARPVPPSIDGGSSLSLTEGYTDAVYSFSVTGNPMPAVSLDSGTAKAVLTDGSVTVPAGLSPGSYSFTLTASSNAGETVKTIQVYVSARIIVQAPTIYGEDLIMLREGYADKQYSYSVTGYPSPTVSLEDTDNTAKALLLNGTLTVPAGLKSGSYSFTLIASNSAGESRKKVTIQISSQLGAPTIEGNSVIDLEKGYSDSKYSYNAFGVPIPELKLNSENNTANATLSGDKFSKEWEVTIPSGLDTGSYSFTLTAENAAGTADKAVQVNVFEKMTAPSISGEDTIELTEGYTAADYSYSVTGTPAPIVRLKTEDNTAKAELTNGEVTVPEGLTAGNYSFTLIAENSEGQDSKTVHVNVSSLPSIIGPTEINLLYMYTDHIEMYSITGEPAPILSLESTEPEFFDLSGNLLVVKSGLHYASSPHVVTIVAENKAGKVELPVIVNVYGDLIFLTCTANTQAVSGDNFNWILSAQGGAGGPYTYRMVDGELPNGLTLSSDGVISGTPTGEIKQYRCTVQVTDSKNLCNTAHDLSITLIEPAERNKDTIKKADESLQKKLPDAVLDKCLNEDSEITQSANSVKEPSEKVKSPAKEPKDDEKDPTEAPSNKEEDSDKQPAGKEDTPMKESKEKEPVQPENPSEETLKGGPDTSGDNTENKSEDYTLPQ